MSALSGKEIEKVIHVFRENFQPIPLDVYVKPYEVLVSTMLSARTKDETTLAACERLFAVAADFKALSELNVEEVEELIFPVGFYKTKAKHLMSMSKIVLSRYGGEVPKTQGELIALPGVGVKTANLVVQRLGYATAIAVDTHVHKISNLLGWVNTKTPGETERALVDVLPKKYWHEINSLFVSVGQQHRNKKDLVSFLKSERLL
ncbi:endonuclease III [candidate division WWE3 bacterium]|uniref:Endonuclease III n=1 Tax=candidate division WWE3 bacterium TaxID=2053526 RepID=A0A955LJ57_UNCKA|nr:endonuclease III [candidate division WWE3 bacterium]